MISRMSIVVGTAGCWSGVVSGVVSGVMLLMAKLSINGGTMKESAAHRVVGSFRMARLRTESSWGSSARRSASRQVRQRLLLIVNVGPVDWTPVWVRPFDLGCHGFPVFGYDDVAGP